MKALLFLYLFHPAPHFSAQEAPLPCNIGQLSVTTDTPNGTLIPLGRYIVHLTLHNVSTDACTVPPLPSLAFDDASEQPLDVPGTFQGVRGGDPFPAVLPLTLLPHTKLTSILTWGTPHPIDQNICLHTVTLTYSLGPETRSIPFEATFCGQPRTHFTVTRLKPDPPAPIPSRQPH